MTDVDRFNRLLAAGLPPTTALDVLEGKTSEAEALEGLRRSLAAQALLALPVRERPRPALAWDLSAANWHRAMDHCDPAAFAEAYPDADVFSVGRADLVAGLAEAARRRSGPWSSSYRTKTARLVAHLEAGGRVTPPLVTIVPTGLALAGGYHRLGWAQFRRAPMLPVLLSRCELRPIAGRLATLVDDGGAAALRA